jgi:DNA-binding MarR family transcriptional regulator
MARPASQFADDELPILLVRAAKAMAADAAALAEAADPGGHRLSPVHGLAARYLATHEAVTTVELAQHLRVTKQSASEVVGGLEAGGYLRRLPHPDDGRARIVQLTASGLRKLDASRVRWQQVEDQWADVVGAADLAVVRRTLEAYLGRVG